MCVASATTKACTAARCYYVLQNSSFERKHGSEKSILFCLQLINAEIDTVILFCLRLIDGGKNSIYGTAPNPKVQPVWKEKISKKGMEYKKINIQKSFILIGSLRKME